MKRIILLLGVVLAAQYAQSVPLETFQSFTTDHGDEARRARSCQLVARGTGTDTMYFVEVDPTTGALPVDASVSLSFTDTDFGATTNSQRVAAVLGNSTAEAAFGTGTRSAQTLRVTVATDDVVPVTVTTKQWGKIELITNDHSSTAITTSAYVQLVASTSADINRFHIFDSSGEGLIMATGAAASEVDQFYIPPGGLDSPLDFYVASGTRLSVKALTGNTSAGDLIITALD